MTHPPLSRPPTPAPSQGLDADKAPLLHRRFEFGCVPEYIREARLAEPAPLSRRALALLARPVLFLGHEAGLRRLQRLVAPPERAQALARAQAMRSVLLVAYGASAHVALHYALRHRARVAGVVIVGAVPDLRERTVANALSRGVLRLAWAGQLADISAKSRIIASNVSERAPRALARASSAARS